jgi:hypothetical protein
VRSVGSDTLSPSLSLSFAGLSIKCEAIIKLSIKLKFNSTFRLGPKTLSLSLSPVTDELQVQEGLGPPNTFQRKHRRHCTCVRNIRRTGSQKLQPNTFKLNQIVIFSLIRRRFELCRVSVCIRHFRFLKAVANHTFAARIACHSPIQRENGVKRKSKCYKLLVMISVKTVTSGLSERRG